MTKAKAIALLRRKMIAFLQARKVEFDATGKERYLREKCFHILHLVPPPSKEKARAQLAELFALGSKHHTEPTPLVPVRIPAVPWGAPKVKKNFYDTDEWRQLRYRVLKAHNGCCQCCGASASEGAQLHVDHIKPRSKFPELELEFSNMQVLCRDCNLGKGAWDQTDWRAAAE